MVDVASGPIVPMYTPSSTASKSRAKADARPSTRADYIEPGEKIAGAEAVRACEKSPSCSADLLGPPDAEGLPTRCSADLQVRAHGGPDRLRQGYGGPPKLQRRRKLHAKAEGLHYDGFCHAL